MDYINYKFKGNFGELILNVNGTEATGTFQKNGTLKGAFINNTFKGQWENKGLEGLIEFTITGDKLEGNWKKGLEPGSMKGKWEGEIIDNEMSLNPEHEDILETAPGIENTVNININGRISNYMFGLLGDEAYAECEKGMSYAIDDDIETIGEFVKMFYETTLYGGDGMEIFKESIDMEQFKSNCPLLSEFLELVEEGEASHLQFYEDILDMSWDEVNIIEEDAAITITVNDKEIVSGQKLSEFLGEWELVDEDDDPRAAAKANAFWAKYREQFNIHEDTDEFTVYKAENGVLILNEWIEPEGLKRFKTRERNITVEHDNIVDFDYFFKTIDLDLSKLAFLQYGNADDFHRSAPKYVGSFLSYDNNIIRPDQNIHRDKGFTLYYEEGLKSCDFFIEG